jgi:hypothetical protein
MVFVDKYHPYPKDYFLQILHHLLVFSFKIDLNIA